MIFKWETISFDKKNLPPYIFKFNVALVAFFISWFVLCLPPLIAVGAIFGDSAEFYITLCVLMGAFFVGVVIFCVIAAKLRERLVAERAAELEEIFYDMPIEEAENILKERGVINGKGFVSTRGDLFGEKTVPFDKIEVSVCATACDLAVKGHSIKKVTHPLKIDISAYVYDGVDEGDPCAQYKLDCALFNFLDKKNLVNYEDNRGFAYLATDKKNFVRRVFGFKLK